MHPDASRKSTGSDLSSSGEPKARPGSPVAISVLRRLLGGPVDPSIKVQDRHSPMKHLRRFGANESGAAVVIAAILFPVVIGGMGLGAETGYWYLSQRMLQHAADVSAHAAGSRQRAGDTKDKIDAAALHVATESGYSPGTLTVNIPPQSGAFAGDADSIEVIVSDTQPRLFSAVFNNEPVTISGRAVSKVMPDPGSVACVLALSPTASNAVNVSGSASLSLEGCNIASNSNSPSSLNVTSTASTGCAYAVGEAYTPALTLSECAEVKEYAPKVRDPYAHIEEPDLSGIDCQKDANGQILTKYGQPNSLEPPLTPTQTLANGVPVMRFCNGFDAKGTIDFKPGVYVIEQSAFKMTSSNEASILRSIANSAGEEGVTFYFREGGYLQLAGTRLDLAAPSNGPYAGLLFFGSRSGPTVSHQVGGNSESSMTGAVYTPASAITVAGNAQATGGGCTQVIGDTVTFTGNSTLQSTCDTAGTSDIHTNETVKIVE